MSLLSAACSFANRALLSIAALLVPAADRPDWRKEWHSELWHIRKQWSQQQTNQGRFSAQKCSTNLATFWVTETEIAAFCLGAFADAHCLRLHAVSMRPNAPRTAGSAMQCILLLIALTAATYGLSTLLPGVRSTLQATSYQQPQNLMLISWADAEDSTGPTIRAGQFRSWKARRQQLFTAFAYYQLILRAVDIAPDNVPELSIARATPNLLELLGLPPDSIQRHMAASFEPTHRPGYELNRRLPAMVLTDDTWHRYFGDDPYISGRILHVGLREVQVIGVIPIHLWTLPGKIDAWLLEPDAAAISSDARGYLVGRLSPTASKQGLPDRWTMSAPTLTGQNGDFFCSTVSLSQSKNDPRQLFLFTIFLACLALPATTSLPLGDYPASPIGLSWSTRLRRWTFLLAKIALILPTVYFSSLDLAHLDPSIDPTTAQYIQLVAGFCISLFAMRWSLRDQRRRCPVCIGKLTHPAQVGEPSRNFLAWNGTELICTGGHGLLHVPETPTSWFSNQRWLYLDPSWGVLFSEPGLASSTLP